MRGEFGAVSAETAAEMARAAARLFTTDYGVGITGVAGADTQEGHEPGVVFASAHTAGRRPQARCVGNRREIKAQAVEQPMELVTEVLLTKCGAAASHAGNDGPAELIRICERTDWWLGDFRHQQSIGSLDRGEPMLIKYKPRHRVGRWFQAITAESPAPQMPTPIPPMTDVPPPPTIPGTMPPTIDPPEPPFVPTPPPPRVDPPPPPFVPTPAPPRVDPPPPPTVPSFVQRLFGEPDEPPPAA